MPKIMIIGCGRLGQIIGNFFQINKFSVVGIRRSKVELSKFPMHAYDIFSNEFDIFFQEQKPDYIIYSATPSSQDPKDYEWIYFNGLKKVKHLSSQLPKTKLFFISSTRVFNGHHNDILLDDDTPTNPSDPQGEVLVNAERLIADTDDGIVFRLSGIYGLDRQMMIGLAKSPHSWPENRYTNRIFDTDAAHIIYQVIGNVHEGKAIAPPRVINVTDSQPIDLYTVLLFIRSKLKLQPIEDLTQDPVQGKRIVSSYLLKQMNYKFQYPDYQSGYLKIISTLID
jgi:nucleoside-diphosphate-sugar epimerase